jgi:hypothetical protein
LQGERDKRCGRECRGHSQCCCNADLYVRSLAIAFMMFVVSDKLIKQHVFVESCHLDKLTINIFNSILCLPLYHLLAPPPPDRWISCAPTVMALNGHLL